MAVRYGSTSKEHLRYKPEEFSWENQQLLDQKTNQYMNRDAFSYDVANDPMYKQYKEQYAALGNLAMQDTMGQAAALTGGYGNTYAQTAGQQTYQNYLNQVNQMVPELAAAARSNYEAEGNRLYNEIALLEGQKATAYNAYQNDLNDWYNYLNMLQNQEQIAIENERYDREMALQERQLATVEPLTTTEFSKWRDMFASEKGNPNGLINLRDQLASMGYEDQAFALYAEYIDDGLTSDSLLDQLNAGKTIKEIEAERMAASTIPTGKVKTAQEYLSELARLKKFKK